MKPHSMEDVKSLSHYFADQYIIGMNPIWITVYSNLAKELDHLYRLMKDQGQ